MSNSINTEPYRPQYHFTPHAHWMNDPNGLVYYEGEYHLFYQYYPHGTTWGPMHWGYAVSKDMVHWEHLPTALFPDSNGYIFSGSAVVDRMDSSGFFQGGAGLVAIFTSHLETNEGSILQRQSIAYSMDRGRTWMMYDGNPVLADTSMIDFRDPKVFWDERISRWLMVLAAGDHVRFYHSPNLIDWTFSGKFGSHEGSHEGVWECPDLFELSIEGREGEKRWVLIVSIGNHPEHPEGSRTQYFIGDFDGYRFVNDNASDTVLWLDHGRDNYAGVTWSGIPNEDGRRLFIAWMSNWKYADKTPTLAWRGAMTLPRSLHLRSEQEGVRLAQSPVVELQSLRQQPRRWEEALISANRNLLNGISGDRFEIEAEIEVGSAQQFGFKLRMSENEETVIGYDTARQLLFVDRSKSGNASFHELFPGKHEAQLEPNNGRIRLHLFVDMSSVEVFANDGRIVMTELIFPDSTSQRLELYAIGGDAILKYLNFYPLQSIQQPNA
jgi:fructan beta-fructosidase